MAKKTLAPDSQFVVGEEKLLNYILTSLFFALFLYGLIDILIIHTTDAKYTSFLALIALVPAFISFKKAKSKRNYLRVNRKGIYQDEKLVTEWANFIKAYIDQKEVVLSIQDNFGLVIEHLKTGSEKIYRRRIPLTNTQNKSEEQVMAAIKFFAKDFAGNIQARN